MHRIATTRVLLVEFKPITDRWLLRRDSSAWKTQNSRSNDEFMEFTTIQDNYIWYTYIVNLLSSFIRDDDEIVQEQLSLCQYYYLKINSKYR